MSTLAYLARRFVAGEKREDALSAVAQLNQSGLAASLDLLGENVSNAEEAHRALQEYLSVLEDIHRRGLNSNVSIKLTAMGLDIGYDVCRSNMKKILACAQEKQNFVRIDMEGSAYTERTLQMFRDLFREHSNVGVVIQAYLRRSEFDCRALGELKAPIRVCKGAYKEPASIAFTRMNDIRTNYKSLVKILLKAGSRVGIATHDEQLIRWAIEWTTQENIPRSQFEFQMLFGLRRKRSLELKQEGYSVRTYVPYGTHWFPYFVRRLRERKENILFVLKSLVAD